MINQDRAAALHLELLHAAMDEIVSAVLHLHAPSGTTLVGSWPACAGCVGTIQGDMPVWPDDCATTRTISPYLHVDLPK